jgi:hypothetical protein
MTNACLSGGHCLLLSTLSMTSQHRRQEAVDLYSSNKEAENPNNDQLDLFILSLSHVNKRLQANAKRFEAGSSFNLLSLTDQDDGTNSQFVQRGSQTFVHPAKTSRDQVRCAFSDRKLHMRMPLVLMPARLKLLHARDQWHFSRESTALTGWHCKLCPNTEGGSNADCCWS